MYVCTCGYICVYKMVLVDLFVCRCDLRDDSCSYTFTEEGEILYHDLCPHKNSATVDSGHRQMQVGAHERKCQPFSWHVVVKLPALLLTTLAQDHGIRWQ